MSIENINFDIFYRILEHSESSSFKNLLLSSKKLYVYNSQISFLLVKKIIENLPILKNVPLKITNNRNLVLYKFLNKLDNIYKGNVKMSNILIHYIHFRRNDDLLYLFEFLIDNCYNKNTSLHKNASLNKVEQNYHSIHILPHIIKYCSIKELDIIIKTIPIPYKTISLYFDYLDIDYSDIDYQKINKLFNYLCWKHFFGFQNEISEINSHNILFCKLIELYENKNKNLEDNYFVEKIVSNIINKQKIYKFIFDYQMLFNKCIICNSEYYLDFILNNLYIINIDRASNSSSKLLYLLINSYIYP
jgi:hypothetical protein